MEQERKEQYLKMIDEDNTMLVEDNEILRNKITAIENFIDKDSTRTAEELKGCININVDYFIGQRRILTQIKKML